MQISFSPPDMTQAEIDEVVNAIKSGWITTGPKTKELERKIAQYCKGNKAVCLNSATACMETALRILEIGHGDEVISSAYSYTASASVGCHVGATVKLSDIQKDSLEIDYDSLYNAINENTKVIIPVDVAGIMWDYEKLSEVLNAKKHLFKPSNPIQEAIGRVIILDDAAHAFGAQRKGRMCGEVADFTSFSFHAVKNLTTAEGGALTWRSIDGAFDEQIYKECMLMSLHGQSKDAFSKSGIGEWEYDIVYPGYKCNMTDVLAALGLAQLSRYDDILKRRHSIIEKYNSAFSRLNVKLLNHKGHHHISSGHLYMIRVGDISEVQRNEIIVQLGKLGVATNVHYKPLPMMTAYKNMGFDIKDFPNAYDYYKNEITLPLHTCLTDTEVDYVIDCVCKVLEDK